MRLDTTLDVDVGADAVAFTLAVANADTEPATFEFTSGLGADFAVYEGDTEVWRWSDGRLFTRQLRTERLAPGEAVEHTGTWEDPPSGEYEVVARLETTSPDVEERAAFGV